MKLSATLILLPAAASAAHLRPVTSGGPPASEASADTLPAPVPGPRVVVLYGEPTPRHHAGSPDSNRTESAAQLIAAEAGVEATFFEKPYDNYDFAGYDAIIAGAPTYNTGDMNYRSSTDWDDWLYDELPNIDVRGKHVAIFGSGKPWYSGTRDDGSIYWKGYGDNFGDAMGELYDRFAEAGATMYGFTDGTNTDPAAGGFNYTKSKFVRNGMFMGQMFDQKSQEELSPGRAKDWVQQLRDEGFFPDEADARPAPVPRTASTN